MNHALDGILKNLFFSSNAIVRLKGRRTHLNFVRTFSTDLSECE